MQTTTMAHRLIAPAVGAAALLAAARPRTPRSSTSSRPSGLHPQVWVAARRRRGRAPARRGDAAGRSPRDGKRVAWRTFGTRDAVFTAATAGGPAQRVVRGRDIGELALSPDGTRLAVGQRRSVVVYDTATRKVVASVRGHAQGLSVLARLDRARRRAGDARLGRAAERRLGPDARDRRAGTRADHAAGAR